MKARLLTCLLAGAAGSAAAALLVCPVPSIAEGSSFAQVKLGKELVAAGDCEGCHTGENGASFAGGRPLKTPFGTIYAANITPDVETGIGAWTEDQFYRAMHEGIAANGSHLYPAFPYPWLTKASRADVDAIRAYLQTVPAVRYRPPPNALPVPLSDRESMVGWNALYFKAGSYVDDPNHTPQWNRGAYLVLGLGHCGACHTPLNVFGAAEHDKHLQGGALSNWYAPSLVGDKKTGLGDWSEQEIVDFLKAGQVKDGVAFGPMREVVHYSTSKMSEDDLKAIAVYLKSLPATNENEAPNPPPADVAAAGQAIYADSCSACHGANGQGVTDLFPPLHGNAIVQGDDPTTVIRLILNGEKAVSTAQRPTGVAMPAFGWKLSDEEVAAVASYVRSAWGNSGSPVSASKVESVRKAVRDVTSED